ncbi:MAG TPA: DUF1552 domain-containing protein [Terriglobia bacterium]|nr:DUF1552 domain-containing protein [Terriglobia bacterium]
MMIFRQALPRRTFLRGMGATLALPLLDAMVPAFASTAGEVSGRPNRLSIVYAPTGMIMDQWTPATEGAGFAMPPILTSLEPFRDRMLVLSGLALKNADAILPGEGAVGNHSRASATFLSGVHPKKTEGADIEAGTSIDQIAAREFGKKTQLASLELCMESDLVGTCERGYSCAYLNTLCWRTPTTPLPMETQPRAVFERFFGDTTSTDPAARRARLRENRSILDSVRQEVERLARGLHATDRHKLDQYLEAIRDVERRIQLAEEQSAKELPSVERPLGVPATFEEYAKLMFDMMVLAYQSDLTRVITMMIAREQSALAYPEIGVGDPHHPLTHHNGDPAKIAGVLKINRFHMRLFAYYLDRLNSIADGDGSLLDHTMVLLGSAISDGNLHLHDNLPILLLEGGTKHPGGRHIRYPQATPLANLYLTMFEKLGIPLDNIGDSTGKLNLLPI